MFRCPIECGKQPARHAERIIDVDGEDAVLPATVADKHHRRRLPDLLQFFLLPAPEADENQPVNLSFIQQIQNDISRLKFDVQL